MPEYTLIGKPIPRLDGNVKVTGQATYAADLIAPGMLHGKVLRSPHAHAKILSIDTSKAAKLPGVRAFCTGKDFPGIKFGFLPSTRDQLPMPIDKVRYFGEGVAAVAAEDEDTAEEALDLIKVEYEPLPAVFSIEEALAEGAPLVHDHAKGNVTASNRYHYGDVDKAFKESDYVVENTFRSQRVIPGFIEPHAILASVDAEGKVLFQASKQSPYITWRHFCRAMGLPLSKVRMISYYIGGGFSGKQDPYDLDFAAVKLAQKTGRPVKIVLSQQEVLAAQRMRHSKRIWIKMGAKKDGTLTACDCKAHSEGGGYAAVGALNIDIVGRCLTMPYRMQNIRYEGHRLYTNKPICGAVRGQAQVIGRYAAESIMSQLADEAGFDQLDFRLKNAYRNGDVTCNGSHIYDFNFLGALEKVGKEIGWEQFKKAKQPWRGIGFGAMMHAEGSSRFSGYTSSAAVVKVTEDATVTIVHGGTEIGQGIDTVCAQIAGEVLGIPMEDITVAVEDTEYTLLEAGMYASRGTVYAGGAVHAAAEDARRQLAVVAAGMLKVPVEQVEFKNRRVFDNKNPSKGFSLQDVVRKAYYDIGQPVYGRGSWSAPRIDFPDFEGTGLGTHPFAYAAIAQAVEAEIDPETGKTKLVQSVTVDEHGQPVNTMMLDGQLEGGTICEMGQTLSEEMLWDKKGIPLTTNFLEYKMPTVMDAPPQKVFHMLCPSPHGPFGAKGGGEHSTATSLAAIVNAVCAASGNRFNELPISPPKMLEAVKKKAKGKK
ncbi:MAG: dehydrogenase [Dehalococcoidia bacterium]|nr:dehydrogenase [Dehalococcoidia bacterium]